MRAYMVFTVLAAILAAELWRLRGVPWTWPRRTRLLLMATAVGAVAVYLGFALPYVRSWDYLNGYYNAGNLFLRGATDQFYSHTFPITPGGFVNLPILSVLYVPLALLPPRVSVLANGALGLASTGITLYLLVRGATARAKTIIQVLFLTSGPLWYSVTMGNVSHFLLLPMYGVFVWSSQRRDRRVGVLLGVLVVFKPFLLVLPAYFTLRRRFRITAACVLTLAAAFGSSVAVFGLALNLEWWRFLGQIARGPMSGFTNQSINGFLVRLLQSPMLLSYTPQAQTRAFVVAKVLLTGSALGALGWVLISAKPPRSRQEEWLEISIVLCAGMIVAPIAWTYYYALLLIPLAFHVRGELPIAREGQWPLVLGAALLAPPVQSAFLAGLPRLLYERILISHYFLGGALLFWGLLSARRRVNLASLSEPSAMRSSPTPVHHGEAQAAVGEQP